MLAINNVSHIQATSQTTRQNSQQPLVNFNQHVQGSEVAVNKPWHERAIAHLDNCVRKLDEMVPNSIIQNKIDQLGEVIEGKFAPLKKFNDWLNENEMGTWYRKLAVFLVKLPMQAVRNIVRLLYNIIKGVFYTAVHPMKAAIHLAKLLVRLAHEFTKPETWSKMGAGMLGASAGHAIVSGNPYSVIGLGIGAGMVVGGISIGMLKTALENEKGHRWDAVKEHLLFQLKALPEAALTGLIMGLIMGGIERAVSPPVTVKVDEYVNQIIQQNNLPASTTWSFDPSSGKITILAPYSPSGTVWYEGVKIEILPSTTSVTAFGNAWTRFQEVPLEYTIPAELFEKIAVKLGQGYPLTILPQAASSLAGAAGTAGAVTTLKV